MDGDEFEERLISWLGMPGEGEPYPHRAKPYPEDDRDVRFDALWRFLERDRAYVEAIVEGFS
jgi:hypothetical protein